MIKICNIPIVSPEGPDLGYGPLIREYISSFEKYSVFTQ